ncbi:MAG: Flap endonuclease Xni [Candidatus Celerinatantimonas neptuna]|nr:MAG: Flap endonuclease Xni [Candidatus Celerinatantimonas neptuna]
MQQQLLIIDALNLIRRIDAISQKHSNKPEQIMITTIQQTLNSINRLIKQFSPTHMIAVFDCQGPDWRQSLYPEYKANRSSMPDYLVQAIPQIQDRLLELSIDSLYNPAIQADDLIATIAYKASTHRLTSTIISTDHGYWPLLKSPDIHIYDYFNKRFITQNSVQEKYNLKCHQLVDYWALTGSNSVNLKGVPGIGTKTAQKLIHHYGNLDAILNHTMGHDKLIDKVLTNQKIAKLTYKLMQLVIDLPLGFNLKQLRYRPKSPN